MGDSSLESQVELTDGDLKKHNSDKNKNSENRRSKAVKIGAKC